MISDFRPSSDYAQPNYLGRYIGVAPHIVLKSWGASIIAFSVHAVWPTHGLVTPPTGDEVRMGMGRGVNIFKIELYGLELGYVGEFNLEGYSDPYDVIALATSSRQFLTTNAGDEANYM